MTWPALDLALQAALAGYVLAALALLLRPAAARTPLGLAAGLHLAATVGRGAATGAFPLSNRMESLSAAGLAVAGVLLVHFRPSRRYALPLLALAAAFLGAALSLPTTLAWPFAMLRTLWYPLHVPLSFVSYGLWYAAGAAALAWLGGREHAWLEHADRLALQGFAIWSVSMVFGGIWGVVAWGATFIWDPKLIWSVVLWFHYAALLHMRLSPSLAHRPGLRAAALLVGALWVLVAHVGTSFFFGGGIHAF